MKTPPPPEIANDPVLAGVYVAVYAHTVWVFVALVSALVAIYLHRLIARDS